MIYTFGEYELDTRVYELRQSGQQKPVEPQVFDILTYLVENRDRVISKEELLEKLWPDRFVSETTLTSRLKEVRKAVGDSGRSQTLIRTHHGRGYRFVADVAVRERPASFVEVSGQHLVRATTEAAPSPLPQEVRSHLRDFVGRRSELDVLSAALERALQGARQVVFITGEAGAGKTTLVDTFLYRCSGAISVARGQCLEHRGSGEAYMPLLDALGRLCRERGASAVEVLRREAPSWLLQLPSLVSSDDQVVLAATTGSSGERMLRELGMAMDRIAADVPLLLILEDLHWSDSATLDAIGLLARQKQPARLLVIGTYRPAEVIAGGHPIHALCQELRVRRQCEVIALPLLLADDLQEYLDLRFGRAPFTPELTRVLLARTAGNPLFVGNLVDSWVARGMIAREEGGWKVATPVAALETDVPESLQALIEQQVTGLEPEQQRILETASVVGRSFTIAVIAATLPNADEEDVEWMCEDLAREGRFIRAEGTDLWGDGTLTARFTFSHDLYPDVIYERIPVTRRARIHQQAGMAFERAFPGRERDHAAALAVHFQRAHDRDRAVRYLQLAAEQALERSAYREAALHLTAAVALVSESPASEARDRTELEIRCRLAPALIATRGWADAEAEESFLRARELARLLQDSPRLSQTLYGMANMYEYRGEYGTAEVITNERLVLDGTAKLRNALESHELLTCSMLHQGRYREAVEHGERAIAAFRELGTTSGEPLLLMVQAFGWVSGSLFFAGRADDALAHSAEALQLGVESGDDFARASSLIQAAFLRFYRREGEACSELALAGLAIARERRFPFHVACGRILSGWWMACEGNAVDGMREIRAGIRTSAAIGARMDMPLFLAILALALERDGHREAALRNVDEAVEIVRAGRTFFYEPELHRMRGLLLSDPGDAAAALQHALMLAEEQGSPLFALRAAASLVRLDSSKKWKKRLRAIFDGFRQGQDTADYRDAEEILAGEG